MKYLGQIEAYWERRMSREEEEAFERELATNAGLREAMKAYEASLRLLELAAVETPHQKKPGPKLSLWLSLAAALALLLAIALFAYANLNYTNERLAQSSYEAPIFSDIRRGESTEGKTQEALAAFAAGHYSQTIDILEAEADKSPTLSYLLSHAYYRNGDMDKAAGLFLSLAQQSSNPYRQGAGWYLALARLRAGKAEAAKQQLVLISREPGNPNQQRAADLLRRLNSGWRKLVVD